MCDNLSVLVLLRIYTFDIVHLHNYMYVNGYGYGYNVIFDNVNVSFIDFLVIIRRITEKILLN